MVLVITYKKQDEGWQASVLSLPGCHTEAATKEEARQSLEGSLHFYFDHPQLIELTESELPVRKALGVLGWVLAVYVASTLPHLLH